MPWKLINAEPQRDFVGQKQKQGSDDAKRYEITWRELQNRQRSLGIVCAHNARLNVEDASDNFGGAWILIEAFGRILIETVARLALTVINGLTAILAMLRVLYVLMIAG